MIMALKYPCDCYICGNQIESEQSAVMYTSYWSAVKIPVCKTHTELKQKKLYDAYECQTIDADCNDCKHFKRGKRIMIKTDNGERGSDSFHGYCMKFDKPTTAHVNFASGNACFEHRKA